LDICLAHSDDRHEVRAAILACNILANDSAKEREYKQGESFVAAVRKKHPEELGLLTAEATLRVIQGKTDKSLGLFEEIVKRNDRDPLALNNLATMLAEVDGRRDEALRHIEKALAIVGREPSLLDTKGTILLFDGKAEAAAENLEAAAREADADPRYRFHLALAYQALNRIEDANTEFQRALARNLEKQILTAKELELLAQLRSQLASSEIQKIE
jgi:Flp pilus assembly protein TadD